MSQIFRNLIIVTGLVLATNSGIMAQNAWVAPQSVYVELGGNAGLYSINYDAILKQGTYVKYGTRVGLAYWHTDGGGYVAPVSANVLFGRVKNYIEVGAGVTFRQKFAPENAEEAYAKAKLVGRLGYREQPVEKGFTWGVSVLPQYNLGANTTGSQENTLNVGFGVHFGYAWGGKSPEDK